MVFTARTEGFIRGRPDIDETIRRLKAFADAGADCLYSPGIKTREHIEATVKAVGGKAINFLNYGALGFTVSDLAGMGVRRISVGGSLARVAMHAFIKTATRDRQGRQVRRLRRPDHQRRAEQVLRRGPQEQLMMGTTRFAGRSARRSIATPAQLPGPVTLARPLRHRSSGSTPRGTARRCWDGVRGHDDIWAYMPATARSPTTRRLCRLARRPCEHEQGADFYAVVDAGGRAVGISTLMEIRPAMRVVEVGHIVYSPALQRTPLGTEAQYLLARYAFETLGYRRYEWKCNALNAPSRRAALRYGFTLRGHPAPAHDRQGPQPRHRLFLHARQRMAGAQGRVRALARAGEFR